ncbi:hypothetical protein [Thalassotalea marina]|uniref:TonB C-terminal domain-containing protein n=1 Tax=Thalassotalea marina TaxID=1673741 RepID=A0A919EKH5_9GAMM|nr:hypothetical protein [Thalassotalea marina]GHF89470.1 hypothetical protein GCM10017161_16650 [Thalassotalea marina]
MQYLVYLLMVVSTLTVAADSVPLPKNPKTFAKTYHSNVLVNVFVNKQGKAKQVVLVNPNTGNPHKELALLSAKRKTYAVKRDNGKPVEYWMNNIKITFEVSSMPASINKPASIESKAVPVN